MLLNEMFQKVPSGLQDVKDDESRPQWGNTRKTKLTLRQINKLRRMNDVRAYEKAKNLKKVRNQYSPPPAAPGL